MAFTAKPRAKGAGKQFGGGGGKTPFTATPKKATASMQGGKPQSEAPSKSIARKDAQEEYRQGAAARTSSDNRTEEPCPIPSPTTTT